MPTKIEWTQESWNPISGCTKVSTGCRNCYAERMAKRLAGRFGYPKQPKHFKVTLHPDKLDQPLKWKKPRMIFVCSMGDLFHEDVDDDQISAIWHRMIAAKQHTFQVLTKRPKRMTKLLPKLFNDFFTGGHFTPPNIWLGVTAENQQAADDRIPWLLKTPAAVRFVSVEPMLGPVNLTCIPYRGDQEYFIDTLNYRYSVNPVNITKGCDTWCDYGLSGLGKVDWVICGGETGIGAREMKWEWAQGLYQQCQEAGVPFFFKKPGDAFNGADGLKAEALAWKREFPEESEE